MSDKAHPQEELTEPWIELLRHKLGTIRFGSVEISIHEGRVTQLEVREKTRIVTPETSARNTRLSA